MEPVVVIDFETTELSPNYGDRATEIAAVLIPDGRIVDQYRSLISASAHPLLFEHLIGIRTAMLRKAPPASQIMTEVAERADRQRFAPEQVLLRKDIHPSGVHRRPQLCCDATTQESHRCA